ncbi:MAG TPA: hypothetical protein VN909_03760 [Candidatus Dormibacteraeota bacterium]|nr:hypothetical protein [Candidatus Dormibacteraeota bacterium]
MTPGLRSSAVLAVAVFLTAAAPRVQAPIGFVDVARVVASHPLHAVLAQYDREIAALRNTLPAPGAGDPAAQAEHGSAVLARSSAAGESRLGRATGRATAMDLQRERAALAAIDASRLAADQEMNAYAGELRRETDTMLVAYARSVAQRNGRAIAARQQQLHERELTLAFDLARATAGRRLALRLKLEDLHLDRETRSRFDAELSRLNARESDAVDAMRRSDAAVLAAYSSTLRSAGNVDNARMAAQLRAKSAANLALRRRVLLAGSGEGARQPDFSTQTAAFGASYRREADAGAVSSSLRDASADIGRRFAQLAGSDRQAQRETAGEIRTLEGYRNALYRSIVAQVLREAQTLMRARHLAELDVNGPRPAGSVDLTSAVRAKLARF